MKRFLIVLQLVLLFSPISFSQERWDFQWEGKARDCYVYLPQSRGAQAGLPVVFNLYGYGGSYNEARTYHHSHLLGDSIGFITIYPDAFDKRWNSGLGDNPDWPTPNVDDVGFISLIIDSLISRYKIDTARVFACGNSNGGFMCLKLAGLLGNRIAAVASVSGVVTNSTAASYSATQFVPALTIHGTSDNLLPYNGGKIGLFSVDSTIEFLRNKNLCLLPAEVISIPDINPNDQSTVVKYIYRSSTNTSQVVHYKVIGGGHEWPGAPSYNGATVINRDINAIHEIWNFFKQFPGPTTTFVTSAHGASIDRFYCRPGLDSISLTAVLNNPQNHNCAMSAIIKNTGGLVCDSIILFNDGFHGDGNSGDSIWGNRFIAPTEENIFSITVRTDDITNGNYHLLQKAQYFTTAGPIVCNGIVAGKDPGWGETVEFMFNIRNEGNTAMVKGIKANLRSLDTAAIITSGTLITVADISPGQSQPINTVAISFSPWSSGVRDIPIEFTFSSSSVDYWRDTILIHVGSPVRLVQWTNQPSGMTNVLYSVSFTDANNGTTVGDAGVVLHTTNGGVQWTSQSSGTTNILSAVSFTDANNGTIAGEGGTILRTTDGGVHWTSQSSGTTNFLSAVSFTDANNGTIVGEGGTILRTTDGGVHWTSQSSGLTNPLYSVSFTDVNNGTVVGNGGTILRTTNGGAQWTNQSSGIANYLFGVYFTDANNGTAVGEGGMILRTTNGGSVWMKQLSVITNSLNAVSFTDANNGTAVGYGGTILLTTNGGATWMKQLSGTTNFLNSISFTDAKNGTAVGYLGTILRTTTGGVTWAEDQQQYANKVPTEYLLEQNYPNPFNPTTVISYQLPVTSNVSLKIYDLLGREIATLVNEEQTAGWKEVQWNAKDVSSGIYFYKLQAGSFVDVKKALVVK